MYAALKLVRALELKVGYRLQEKEDQRPTGLFQPSDLLSASSQCLNSFQILYLVLPMAVTGQ